MSEIYCNSYLLSRMPSLFWCFNLKVLTLSFVRTALPLPLPLSLPLLPPMNTGGLFWAIHKERNSHQRSKKVYSFILFILCKKKNSNLFVFLNVLLNGVRIIIYSRMKLKIKQCNSTLKINQTKPHQTITNMTKMNFIFFQAY